MNLFSKKGVGMGVKLPDFILSLPEIEIPLKNVRGYLLQAEDKQVVFFVVDGPLEIPPHSHKAQWGTVLDGKIRLRIGNEKKELTKGDSYYIPEGVEHEAYIYGPAIVMDIFNEPARYNPKKKD